MFFQSKTYEKIDLPFGKNYCCPNCKKPPPDNDLGYKGKGEKWPKYKNESQGSTMDGSYHDWDEIHYCRKCKIEYYYSNGAY